MIKPDTKIFEDMARMAGGALNVFSDLREQILNDVKARMEEMATRMDLVPRDDLDRVEALLQKALKDQKDLAARLDKLERKKTKTTPQKPTTKKSTVKKSAKKSTAKKKKA